MTSSPVQRPGAGVCWNCDRSVDAITEITIRRPPDWRARFLLCEECYRTVYQTLVHSLGWVRQEPEASGPGLVVDEEAGDRRPGPPLDERPRRGA